MTEQASLPQMLFTPDQVRAFEQSAIAAGTSEASLMQAAGEAAYQCLLELWPSVNHVHVFCGGGNNGGDGYVVAALAAKRNVPTTVWYLADPTSLKGVAAKAFQYAKQEGVSMHAFNAQAFLAAVAEQQVIVDALLGIGFQGALRPEYAEAIAAINSVNAPVLAIDLPSGIHGETGFGDLAVQADATISFVGMKLGCSTGKGLAACGARYFDDLGLNLNETSSVRSLSSFNVPRLPERPLDAHKGVSGHVLVIGGDYGTGGASTMTSEMALFGGAGLVSLATRPEHCGQMLARRPEVMTQGVTCGQELLPCLERPSVLALGPGLGTKAWGSQLCHQALDSHLPIIMDADALNLLAKTPFLQDRRDNWVLTPHPGEAARLLGISTQEVESDRLSAAKRLHDQWGGIIVLKGAGTIIFDGQVAYVCDQLAPALAAGGMGDVLTGLIAAFHAQGLPMFEAAQLAVWLHVQAGQRLGRKIGARGVLATEVIAEVRTLLNEIA